MDREKQIEMWKAAAAARAARMKSGESQGNTEKPERKYKPIPGKGKWEIPRDPKTGQRLE